MVVVELLVSVPGDDPVFTVVFDWVVDDVPPAGDDLSTIVVLLSFFSAGGFVTVVSFCSHAARKAKLIKMQMYFIITGIRNYPADCVLGSRCWRSGCGGIGGRRTGGRGGGGSRVRGARGGRDGLGLLLTCREQRGAS